MNAERLHAIVIELNQEITKNETVEKFESLISALQSVVNSANTTNQQNLSASLKAMYAAVTNTSSDRFSPTWREILVEIGGDPLFGNALKQNIESIFARNQITPAVALEELKQLHKQLESFAGALEKGISALEHFEVGDERLLPGQCEIGVLIPRKAVNNQLVDFADELNELAFILNTFAEVATGEKDELQIKSISSSDLLVYLEAAAPYAACIAIAIERIVALYKQLLEIRKLRHEIKNQGVPENETLGIENYANKLMEDGIEKLSVEIVGQFYKRKDDGRKNELTNAVRISLNKIANRIDQGFNLEVRVQPLQPKEEALKENAGTISAIEQIQKATASMQFLKLDGKPILKLPEGKTQKSKKNVVEKPSQRKFRLED